jgi:putative protease
MKSEKPELLAPAGGMRALIAAIVNGADAVYLGAQAFSARGYASNFSEKEQEEAIDYAHLRGVKVYFTVNTLLKDEEITSALKLLSRLREMGVDAIIIQDLGLISLVRKYLPDLPLHASTQMTLHNSEGVEFVKKLGIKRVVLSRESSLEDIKRIKEKSRIDIEIFIHGALCISYSGQCLLSSLIGGRSGNRGYCAQPCRKKYRLYCNGKRILTTGEYLLSPKDLNTSSHLGALIEAGIESFKIEGRMKRPEYVAGVVKVYRRLLDRYAENPAAYYVSEEEQEILTQIFNRSFTSGYFFETPDGKLMSRENPHNRGIPAGIVVGYDKSSNRILVKLSHFLQLGDGIMVKNVETMSEDKGKIVSSMHTEKGPVYSAEKGDLVELPFDSRVPSGSTVYRTLDKKLMESLKREIESETLRPKIPVSIILTVKKGRPIRIVISDRDSNTVTIESEYLVEKAEKQPISTTQIEKQLSKLGNTLFEATEINVNSEEDVFVPVGQLNDLRTKAILQLENLRILKWKRKPLHYLKFPDPVEKMRYEGEYISPKNFPVHPLLSVSVYSLKGLEGAIAGGADCIYFEEGFIRKSKIVGQKTFFPRDHDVILKKAVLRARTTGRKIYFGTPKIVKDPEMESVNKIIFLAKNLEADGVLVSNLGILNRAKAENISFIVDSPSNILNSLTFSYFLHYGAKMAVISPELTLEEIKDIASCGPAECIVHGRLELMESEHCLIGGLIGQDSKYCSKPCTSGNFTLVDEKYYEFPLLMDYQCRMHILNSKALCMLEYVPKLLENGVLSLRIGLLEMKSDEEIRKVTWAYRNAIDTYLKDRNLEQKKHGNQGKGFTTGHYFRGVQ